MCGEEMMALGLLPLKISWVPGHNAVVSQNQEVDPKGFLFDFSIKRLPKNACPFDLKVFELQLAP